MKENTNTTIKNIDQTFQTNDEKEGYVLDLSYSLIQSNDFLNLLNLLTNLSSYWPSISNARLTKIIKQIFTKISIDQNIFESIHSLLIGLINFYSEKKMLKLDLECRLINLYLTVGRYKECLEKITVVLKELKKYDDKTNLISLFVYESKAYYELQDFSRAKSSLTSARALAVSCPCPAQLQAQIDTLNGMYLTDEHSYDTAISYFIEALEGFNQDRMYDNAKVALRYIILNKILLSKFEEIDTVLSSKFASSFKDDQYVSLLCSIGKICKKRNLCAYNEILHNNAIVLETDGYVSRHLLQLYNTLLDQNILKIIEPYSHIKIQYISNKMNLTEDIVETKLRMMILDKTINGILDHDTQCLVIYDKKEENDEFSFKNVKILRDFFTEA